MSNLPKELKDVLDAVGKIVEEKEEKVIKEIKMKPEWIKLQEESNKLGEEIDRLQAKRTSIQNEKWAKIRRDLDFPQCNLNITEDGKTLRLIEISE